MSQNKRRSGARLRRDSPHGSSAAAPDSLERILCAYSDESRQQEFDSLAPQCDVQFRGC
jgi:hypothetical protein